MATILKDGSIPHLKINCIFCGCEYDATYRDLFSRYGDEVKTYVKCPCCNGATHLTIEAAEYLSTLETHGEKIRLNADRIIY